MSTKPTPGAAPGRRTTTPAPPPHGPDNTQAEAAPAPGAAGRRLADPQTPVWVLTDAHGLVRSVVPRETILAAVDATRRP
ncbi:hypothetical protein [Micrococcus luteus]|uniref:hypothetical protein n=1 Tax=Micrococcus luteus TaxID=1270 RepID=UPI001F1549A3|nr:hypothetical protein [Micrococcus luteus]